jgi:hypothetical protein
MGRPIVFALALLIVPGLARSQSLPPLSASPGSIGLPLSPIGLPLAPIGLPLPTIGLQPPSQPPLNNNERPQWRHNDRRGPRGKGGFFVPPAIVYFGSTAPWIYEPPAPAPSYASPPPPAAPVSPPVIGRLRLEVEPADILQVFVDGEFVGTLQEVGAELDLEPGSRRIEVRAPGYESLVFDARIVGLRTITYRGALQPQAAPPPPPPGALTPADKAAPPRRQTFYLIPGCYMGNIPPQEIKLPANCDLSRLITHTP